MAAGLLVVISVVLFRSMTHQTRQIQVKPSNADTFDSLSLANRLSKAITFKTIFDQDPAHFKPDEFAKFHDFLEQTYPRVHATLKREVVAGHSLLYTWMGQDEKADPILLAAHMDVVPADPESQGVWEYPPFEGRISDGYIWGRGSLDDKCSVMGILESLEKLLQEGFTTHRTMYIAFGHDEEVGGQNGSVKIAALLRSRGVNLDFVLDEGLSITEGIMPNMTKPAALVGIAEKGCVSMELAAKSEGGHSMMPPQQTAIGILSNAVSKLEKNQFPTRMELPVQKMFQTLAPEMPLGMRVVFSNLWLFEGLVKKKLASAPRTNALVRTTTAPTIFQAGVKENVLATHARAVVNYRLLPGETVEMVTQHIRKTINDPSIEIKALEGFRDDPSPFSDTNSSGYRTIELSIRQAFPEAIVAPGLVLAATDSRHYIPLARNVYRFSPIRLTSEDLPRIHGNDERIPVEDYTRVVLFYTQFIRNAGAVQ